MKIQALLALSILSLPCPAAPKGQMDLPDFTKADAIPEGAVHDWALGATGLRGWIYSDRMVTSDARQILVTEVAAGSPSDAILEKGDVILGVAGKLFSYDPRTEMGKALTIAESEAGKGNLALIRWRAGKQEDIAITLPVLGTYSRTAPYDCEKSKRIFESGCEALAKNMAAPSYKAPSIPRALNALALLASGDPQYLPLLKKEAEWAASFSADSMATWHYGYVMLFLSEYTLASGDRTYLPGLRRIALEAARGQSAVGSWGHKFAGDDGRLVGYGMMNSPGIPLTIALVLARTAGVDDPEVATAIERSARLLRFYAGKGAVPYGDHYPWTQTHEDNGKCGMAAVLFSLLGETETAEFFSRMSTSSHGPERDTGHTGNFFNLLWSVPAISLSGPHATGMWMEEFGKWYFDLARSWDGTFSHQGPPQMRTDSYRKWDCTGAYLLSYAVPLKKTYLTGKQPASIPQIGQSEARSLISDGRGWSNKDRNSAYDELSGDGLFERLASWSPIVRERAAMALARRDEAPVASLIKMLDAPEIEARYGACQALALLKGKSAPAVPALTKALDHEDLWLRIEAAEALAAIGDPAMTALPKLLEMLAKGPTEADPRAMEQRYLSFAVFREMLRKSPLDGVDPTLLREAVTAGLKNQDGRARGAIGGIYGKFSYENLKPLLPAIHEAIVHPAPSGIMFDSQIRIAGIAVLAKHRIREGMPLCIEVMEIEKWGKQNRIAKCLDVLAIYGAAAKPMLPRLRQLEEDLTAHREAKSLQSSIEKLQALILEIETRNDPVELRSLN